MTEQDIQRHILLAASKMGARVFRNNVGTGWVGQVKRTSDGSLIISNPRPLHAGLCKGSSDVIGWTPVVITPDHVGKKIAVFTAIEVKHHTSASADQINFINAVRNAGGIAGISRSELETTALLSQLNLLL